MVTEEFENFFELIKSGDRAGVEEMLAANPSLVSTKTDGGVSAILAAVYNGNPQIADLLVEAGAPLDIFEAAALGREEDVGRLLDEMPRLVGAVAPDGFAPLGLAAFFGHEETAKLLILRGADVNHASENAMKVTPLHSAVAGRHLEIAKALLEAGADPNARQQDNFTPLMGAAQNGRPAMEELLRSYGAE